MSTPPQGPPPQGQPPQGPNTPGHPPYGQNPYGQNPQGPPPQQGQQWQGQQYPQQQPQQPQQPQQYPGQPPYVAQPQHGQPQYGQPPYQDSQYPNQQYPNPQHPNPQYQNPQAGGPYNPGPPGPPYGNGGPPKKKSKGWVWMLSGGAFLLVILVVGAFVGLNVLSKNSGMSHDVVAMGEDPDQSEPSDEPSQSESPTDSPSPTETEDSEPSTTDYGTGACINGDSSTVIKVDCDDAHIAQIYYEEEMPDSSYPGKSAFKAKAKSVCPKHVKGAVDSGTVTSNYTISWLAPNRTQWDMDDDHNVYCLVMRKDGKHFTGTKLLTQ